MSSCSNSLRAGVCRCDSGGGPVGGETFGGETLGAETFGGETFGGAVLRSAPVVLDSDSAD